MDPLHNSQPTLSSQFKSLEPGRIDSSDDEECVKKLVRANSENAMVADSTSDDTQSDSSANDEDLMLSKYSLRNRLQLNLNDPPILVTMKILLRFQDVSHIKEN